MKQIVEGICQAIDSEANFRYYEGYRPVIYHSNETKMIFNADKNVSEFSATIEAAPQIGSADIAFYLENKPGAFFFTGANIPEHTYPHHHPKFNIDERAMPIAAKMLISAYFEYQEHNA